MAIELHQLLSRQLLELPTDHIDKDFIAHKYQETTAYLRETGRLAYGSKKPGLQGQEIGDWFLQFRNGPFLDRAAILREITSSHPSFPIQSYADKALGEIDLFGDQSIAHLCLPTVIFNKLTPRRNIRTINNLKEVMQSGEKILGQRSDRFIRERLLEFDILLAESQKSRT